MLVAHLMQEWCLREEFGKIKEVKTMPRGDGTGPGGQGPGTGRGTGRGGGQAVVSESLTKWECHAMSRSAPTAGPL